MKQFNKFAFAGACLLAGTMGFTGCSSDDELADVNPSYDGSSVKAQFSINIPANTNQSRMTGGQAQESGAFLGMTKINLLPLKINEDLSTKNTDEVNTIVSGQAKGNNITLGDITKDGGAAANNADKDAAGSWNNADIHARVYNDVQFDLGTNYALFYAEGKHTATESCGLTPSYGSTTSNVSNIGFSLQSPYTAQSDIQTYLQTVVNNIAGVLATQGATYAGVKTLEETFKAYDGSAYKVIAGSSKNILAMATNLYASCYRGTTEDASAATGYNAVMTEVEKYFTVEANAVTGFKTDATGYVSGADKFPYVANVPDGSMAIQYNASASKFQYTTYNLGSTYSNWSITEAGSYRKPSSLYYFIQTPIKTKNVEWLYDNIGSKTNWNEVVSEYSGNAVTASTRSMILEKPVQYGVAALETDVVASSENLKDENGDTKTITGNLKITGIIIGGQKDVDWKFQPKGATEYAVYDKQFCTTNPNLSVSSLEPKNYTLLLETAPSTTVNVAIEFENNMEDFYGKDHMLIAKGTKFYLLAKLNPAPATGVTDTPGKQTVFIQDYLTKAKFTVKSLANAYNIIPDLRSPKLEFGLSVDLTWSTGMNFEVDME